MTVWQIKTPAVSSDEHDTSGNITTKTINPDRMIVRWQFKDPETAKLFYEKIRLEMHDTGIGG
jgi:hypothetical protein